MTNAATIDFAEFYTANFQRIAVQIHAYIDDRHEAHDVTQEAFCRALARWSRISEYADPAGWVRRVAWNLATSRWRRRQVVVRYLSWQRVEHAPEPSIDRVAVTDALATLPDKHRRAVVQFHIGRLSIAEIAAAERVPEGTVRSWLSRGRSELAEYFAEFASSTSFQPDTPAVVTQAKRRQRRTVLTTAALAAILGLLIPLVVMTLSRGSGRPPTIPPSPSVTTSGLVDGIPTKQIDHHIGGSPQVMALSERLIWAYYREERRLVRTTDGGDSWQSVPLPQADGLMQILPYGEAAIVVQAGETLYASEDGGKSYTRSTDDDAAPLALKASQLWVSTGRKGDYGLQCPDRRRSEGTEGCRLLVAEIGKGPLPAQPPLPDSIVQLISTDDGRLWARMVSGEDQTIAYSTPSGADKSWHRMPAAPLGTLHPSHDGKDLWLHNDGKVWRFANGVWEPQPLPRQAVRVAPLGWGRLALVVELGDGKQAVSTWDGARLSDDPPLRCPESIGLKLLAESGLYASCGDTFYLRHNDGPWTRYVS